jgi:hypothetical protein
MEYSLNMNMQKAVMMVISRSQDANSRININSTKVKHVAKIMYLESEVYPEGITYEHSSTGI